MHKLFLTTGAEGFIFNTKSKGIIVQNIKKKIALRIVQNGIITNIANGPNVNLVWMPTGIMAGVYEYVVKLLEAELNLILPSPPCKFTKKSW